MTRIAALLCWLALAAFSHGALAQTPSSPTSASAPLISADDFEAMITALKTAAQSMSTFLISEGVNLGGAFFTFGFVIVVLRLFFGPGDPGVKADLFFHFFKATIVLVMLASWTANSPSSVVVDTHAGASGTMNLGAFRAPITVQNIAIDSFDEGVTAMFSTFAGGGGKERVFNVIGQSWNMMWKASARRGEIRDQARASGSINPLNWLMTYFEGFGDKVVTFLAALVVGLLALVLMAVYLFVIYWGDLAAFLGMFMGPLMIPGLLYKRAEFLFDGWLKFMISAGFYKLIAAWTALLTLITVGKIQDVANTMYATSIATAVSGSAIQAQANGFLMDGAFILSIVMTLIYMGFAIMMMLRVGDLTQRLMQGQGGLFAGGMQKVATDGASKVAKAAR